MTGEGSNVFTLTQKSPNCLTFSTVVSYSPPASTNHTETVCDSEDLPTQPPPVNATCYIATDEDGEPPANACDVSDNDFVFDDEEHKFCYNIMTRYT